MSAQSLLTQAINEISYLKTGEVFLVRDLFKGYEWNREPRNDRLTVGTLFLNYVTSNTDKIGIREKTSSNQQKYIIL